MSPRNTFFRLVARGLTIGRFIATIPFLYVLLASSPESSAGQGTALALTFVAIAGSDLLDGFFARLAGAASRRWGQLDALADIVFNISSLLAAVWLGLLGIWVPLSIIILATLFLHRNRNPATAHGVRLAEDRLGKAAGVVYYLLVGVVVLSLWLQTEAVRMALWWLGNLVFLYTLVVLARNVLPKR